MSLPLSMCTSSICPLPMISTATSLTVANLAFMQWTLQYQLILSTLYSFLSESANPCDKCQTSRKVWFALEQMFTSTSHALMMNLHYQLATLKKGSCISDYFHKFTTLADTLATADQPLNKFELVSFLLTGIGPYDSFMSSVIT